MSERELKRVSVVAHVEDGSLTARQAAGVLGLSVRQVQRLKKRAEYYEGV
ncbi:MAG: helix-turn-helix domain-containing protein [Pseudomonadota bacterium]